MLVHYQEPEKSITIFTYLLQKEEQTREIESRICKDFSVGYNVELALLSI